MHNPTSATLPCTFQICSFPLIVLVAIIFSLFPEKRHSSRGRTAGDAESLQSIRRIHRPMFAERNRSCYGFGERQCSVDRGPQSLEGTFLLFRLYLRQARDLSGRSGRTSAFDTASAAMCRHLVKRRASFLHGLFRNLGPGADDLLALVQLHLRASHLSDVPGCQN